MTLRFLALTAVFLFSLFSGSYAQTEATKARTTVLAFGDVNLGRAVGQELLKGNIGYPFEFIKDSLAKAEVVFVNLESQLSDQQGETQHPKYNLIFCGPPVGALSLKQAGVSVVSTANNHAFDYGQRALQETIQYLDSAGVASVGTTIDSGRVSVPVVVEHSGIRVGFLAYTQFMNFPGSWVGHVALYEQRRVEEDIQALRAKVDFVVVSYHGGGEYIDQPPANVRRDFRAIADAGADVVLGHHPHYVQGIEQYKNTLLFYSLGNFVFYQPQHEWTQLGLGVELKLVRNDSAVVIEQARLLAFRAGLQPKFTLSSAEAQSFFQRLKKLSSAHLIQNNGEWFVQGRKNND